MPICTYRSPYAPQMQSFRSQSGSLVSCCSNRQGESGAPLILSEVPRMLNILLFS